MSSNSITLISQNSHPNDSTAETITGEKQKGDGFYSRTDGLHTAQAILSNFTGKIKFQGTLATTPEEADWSTINLKTNVSGIVDTTGAIVSTEATVTELDLNSYSGSTTCNFTGNFIWVRALVTDWTSGSVTEILMNN